MTVPLSDIALVLQDGDDVAVAKQQIEAGTQVEIPATPGPVTLTVATTVPPGHKLAIHAVPSGGVVHKFGQSIGRASTDIALGDHVHVHNLAFDPAGHAADAGTRPTSQLRLPARRTFMGYRRDGARAGTRNYLGVLATVNCSGSTARMIAHQVERELLPRFPHVDGIVPLTHGSGCGLVTRSTGAEVLARTLRGYATHPNISGLLILGLGCEMLGVTDLLDGLVFPADTLVDTLAIQDCGGVRATVAQAVERIEAMLPKLDARRREECDVADLVLGLKCGGSDGYSGISANPSLGAASDLLVAAGGTSILAETPEIFGAEHLLMARATDPAIARTLGERIEWWRTYVEHAEGSLDNNPSPGNKRGGLTTILEKSLGAVAKSGQAPLQAVYQYAQHVDAHGFCFMDTPGYDPVSVTGMVAGGATVVCFTTGRGSVFGCRPTPSLKLATNAALVARMGADIDIDCSPVLTGASTITQMGDDIYDRILDTASGRKSASEELPIGEEEFVPWHLGAVV